MNRDQVTTGHVKEVERFLENKKAWGKLFGSILPTGTGNDPAYGEILSRESAGVPQS